MPPQTKSIDDIIRESDVSQHLSGITPSSKLESPEDRVKTALDFYYQDFDELRKMLPPDVVNTLRKRKGFAKEIIESEGGEAAKASFEDYYKLYKNDPEMMGVLSEAWEKSGKPYFRRPTQSDISSRQSSAAAAVKRFSYPITEGLTPRDTILTYPKPGTEVSRYHDLMLGLEEMGHTYMSKKREGESFEDFKNRRIKTIQEEAGQGYSEKYESLPFGETVAHEVVSPFLKQPVSDILRKRAIQTSIGDFMAKDKRYEKVDVGEKLKSTKELKEIFGEKYTSNLKDYIEGGFEDIFPGKFTLEFQTTDKDNLKKIVPQSGPYKGLTTMSMLGQSPETDYLFKEWLNDLHRAEWKKGGKPTQQLPDVKSEKELNEFLDYIGKWKYMADPQLRMIPRTGKQVQEPGYWQSPFGRKEIEEFVPFQKAR